MILRAKLYKLAAIFMMVKNARMSYVHTETLQQLVQQQAEEQHQLQPDQQQRLPPVLQ